MRISPSKKLVALGLIIVLTLAGSGVALAWFVSGGSGSGTATVGAPGAADFTIVGHAPQSSLYPGGDPQSFVFDAHNTGAASEHVGTVAIGVAAAPVTGYALEAGTPIPGCLARWFTVTPDVVVDATVAAGAWDDGIAGASIALTESGSDQTACAGHAVDLTFTTGLG